MFQLFLLAAIIYILFRWLRQGKASVPTPGPFAGSGGQIEEMVQDPACGTWVPVSQALPLVRGRETLYFCCAACRDKFLGERTNG